MPTRQRLTSLELFVDWLMLLEQRAGANVSYKVYEPVFFSNCSFAEIQDVTKKLAVFANLIEYHFTVSLTKQKENVAGHIDLTEYDDHVFIEVDPNLCDFPNALLATICHELAHKWLQKHRIYKPLEIENEMLTDLACVYLGFGRIMLNGCIARKEAIVNRHEYSDSQIESITHLKVGYLKLEEFALTYRLVAVMRGIDRNDYASLLGAEAINEILKFEGIFQNSAFLSSNFKDLKEKESSEMILKYRELEFILNDTDKYLSFLQAKLQQLSDERVRKLLADHIKKKQHLTDAQNDTNPNPVYQYLLFLRAWVSFHLSDLPEAIKEAQLFFSDLTEFYEEIRILDKYLSKDCNNSEKIIFTCPIDKTKLKIPVNNGKIVVSCPKCKNEFGYNSNLPVVEAKQDSPETGKMKLFAVSMNFLLILIACYFLAIFGMPGGDGIFFVILLFVAPLSTLFAFLQKTPNGK